MKDTRNTSSSEIVRFDKDLVKDINDYHLQENVWTHARNAINNSKTGDLGKIGNEPSNYLCTDEVPYTIIGVVHINADVWAIYSTDNVNSEIGLFYEDKCGTNEAYSAIVNDPCLKFKQTNLVKGVSRARSTCNYTLYWDDGLNPSRQLTVNIDDPEI